MMNFKQEGTKSGESNSSLLPLPPSSVSSCSLLFPPRIEILEDRIAPSVTYIDAAPVLTVNSNSGGDTIAFYLLSGDPTKLVIDVGNDGTADKTVTRANYNTIHVNGNGGFDEVIIDYKNGDPGNLLSSFNFAAGGNTGDKFTLAGTGVQAVTWQPSGTSNAGAIGLGSGIAYSYTGVVGGLKVTNASSLALTTASGADNFTLNDGTLSGTASGASHSLTFSQTPSLTINVNAGTEADIIAIAGLSGSGLANLTVNTGAGADQLNIAAAVTSLALPIAGGAFTFNSGTESDTLTYAADASFTLTDTALTSSLGGTLTLSGVEIANLTGGAGANTFTVSGWSGTGTLNGLAGNDTIAATNDVADFILTNTQLTRTGRGALTLASVEVANLTGGASPNTFTITNWTGAGTLDGLAAADTIVAVTDVATITLSDVSLTRTGSNALTLTNLEVANITGGASSNNFSGFWPGTWNLDGQGGNDVFLVQLTAFTSTVNLIGGADSSGDNLIISGTPGTDAISISATAITHGGETINYSTVETVYVDAAGGDDTYAFTGTASGVSYILNDSANTIDTISVIADGNFNLSSSALAVTATGFAASPITLTSIEVAHLTGGAGANTFTVTDWTGAGTLDGLAGSDTVVAVNDLANLGLSGTQLTRTGFGALTLLNLEIANLTGGASANTFTVNGWTGTANLDGAANNDSYNIAFNGAAGIVNVTDTAGSADTLTVTGSPNADSISLSPTALLRGLEAINHTGVENVNVTGAANDTIVLLGSAASVAYTLSGGIVQATADADFSLSSNVLSVPAAGFNSPFTLSNIAAIHLFGGPSANTFTVTNYTGAATLDGLDGFDTIIAVNDVATFTLSDTKLLRTGLGDLTLANLEDAHLTGGTSANTFVVAGYSKSATLQGLEGNDTFDIQNWSAAGTLDGGPGDDTFILSHDTTSEVLNSSSDKIGLTGWLSNGAITAGGDAGDKLYFKGDASYQLTDTTFVRTQLNSKLVAVQAYTTTISGLHVAELIGGVSRNLIDAGAFSGHTILEGRGGVDNLVASKGGGEMYGFRHTLPTAHSLTSAKVRASYTFDNYFMPDGSVAADELIFATSRAGNAISFRYYETAHLAGVKYVIPKKTEDVPQTVSGASDPALTLQVMLGYVMNVEGSSLSDNLIGSSRSNVILGGAGNDYLTAVGPALDVLFGESGSDVLRGPTPFKFQNTPGRLPGFTSPASQKVRPPAV